MIRKIIEIDREKCNGCGACATACHEGAIAMVDDKAQLMREDYCDGLGDCLPACPTGAITFVTREAQAYDEAAVRQAKQSGSSPASRLTQWPVQIRLVPAQAPYFANADLLIAADCTAYAYGDFHRRFMEGRVVLVGCTKLDPVNYVEKLAQIFQANPIRSVTVVRMEVPCCGGMEFAVRQALAASGKAIGCQVVTISTTGEILAVE